ncbi:GNAT family N-acetyltransferase [Echinicola sp. 20G]|uniref:GNAT family N-acetyltransferase n=1 Tax=Echinicola sp. 20G TaxID=2781961 RepID=UPI0019101302|nr:GNAT family N-acetyltransferase [Echinicola sp. 20G]
MIKTIRTDASHQDFVKLVKLLDAELAVRDGKDHAFYDQFNKIDHIKYAVIAFENGIPISCGAIKEYDKRSMEVKRMYTVMNFRGKGIASVVLAELEKWAKELNYKRCILETGLKQPEAIKLYEKNGYLLIPNYGQYIGVSNSRCFEKTLK